MLNLLSMYQPSFTIPLIALVYLYSSRLGNIESSEGGEELVEEVSDEVAQSIEDATNALKKWADEVSKVKILELKRLNYRAMVDRRAIFTSEASTSKVISFHKP